MIHQNLPHNKADSLLQHLNSILGVQHGDFTMPQPLVIDGHKIHLTKNNDQLIVHTTIGSLPETLDVELFNRLLSTTWHRSLKFTETLSIDQETSYLTLHFIVPTKKTTKENFTDAIESFLNSTEYFKTELQRFSNPIPSSTVNFAFE